MKHFFIMMCIVLFSSTLFAFQQVTYPPELEELFVVVDTAVGKQTLTPITAIDQAIDNGPAFQEFVREYDQWRFFIDTRTGLLGFMDGKGVPFIPGDGVDNTLTMKDLAPYSKGPVKEVTSSLLEAKSRHFLQDWQHLFKVDLDDLVLDHDATFQANENLWYVRFTYAPNGVPVENAYFTLRISHGNIIQFGQEGIGPVRIDPVPRVSREEAWITVEDFLAGSPFLEMEKGNLKYINLPSENWKRPMVGGGYTHILVWDFYLKIEGYPQQFRAWIDAHSGKVVFFRDETKYGHVDGGIYPIHNQDPEEVKPFPYADHATGSYTDLAGYYSGTTGTSTLTGQYVTISDDCGSISLGSDVNGDINFGTSSGIDCDTPGSGGAGNTHSSRSCFYHVNLIKEKARKYKPTNTWLQQNLTSNVNIDQTCNAFWNGSTINFYRSGDGCNNTGELAGVFLHEWGHGLDENDGSATAPDGGSGETYGDWTATLQGHNSCVGETFRLSGVCGYGNACLSCTGVREVDYQQYATPSPATVANSQAGGLYDCPSGALCSGACGVECHCESVLATQALWDLAVRELPAQGYDGPTSWQLSDKLWYVSRGTEAATYQCDNNPQTNGCNSGSIYNIYRAVDDVDGNLNNGTPHAGSIFTSLNRHEIGCGLSTDAANQNSSECPSLAAPALSGTPGDNQNQLSWNSVSGATSYTLYRNELSCDAGFTEVYSGTNLSYTDSMVVNGVTYYYRVNATSNGGDCFSAMSNCQTLTPTATACTMLADVTPNGTTTVCGSFNIVFMATPTGGTAPFTYQWTEDGSDLSGETNTTLTINYASAASHIYNCKVTDSSGVCNDILDGSSSTGVWTDQVSVDVTPNGTTQECTGVNIVFTATPSGGTAPYNYQWTQDSSNISGETNSTLTMNFATPQSHTYNCDVTDSGGCPVAVDLSSSTGDWIDCSSPPPPVADGQTGSGIELSKVSGNTINVAFDTLTCSDDHAVVLYGDLGDFSTYVGAVDSGCNVGNTGSSDFTIASSNIWFNLVWVTSTDTGGHPGFATSGARSLNANGLCSVSADDHSDSVCD